ncbi:hypothetical protein [Paenibacillus senegalensis]|uniref:hypothetical protein n=1 Tax=Paenibacillus senegalensis TaxID=1465766 RepID=UPI00028A30EC|nr:hypothetical protein [Paenibacillus senegalensis]
MKVRRSIILFIFILMLGGNSLVAAEEEEQGIFISRVSFGNVHVNQSTTYSVQVIDRSISPDEDINHLPPVDAEVTVSMKLGNHILAQTLERTDQGYQGTIAFPEEGDWTVVVRASGLNDFAGYEDEVEMSLKVQPQDRTLSFVWGVAMVILAAGIIYLMLRIRSLMKQGKK